MPTTHSYLDVVEANEHAMSFFPLAGWDQANDVDRLRALTEATSRVDAQRYQGAKLDAAQPRAFPRRPWPDRTTVWDEDAEGNAGGGVVPRAVLLAVVAEADALLAGAAAAREQQHKGLASQSAGPVSESYRPPTTPDGTPQLCERATTLLRPYRLKSGRLL